MSEHSNPPNEHEQRLNRIIAEYLESCQAGKAPDRDELLSQHPDLAADLAEFFADEDQFDAMAESIDETVRRPRDAESVAPGSTVISDSGAKVRYFGDYELEEEIARTGMSVVWRARQVSLNRPVAMKMIKSGQFADDKEIQRFRDEAEAAANLDHPNIVPIYEVGEHEGTAVFQHEAHRRRKSVSGP